MYSWTASRFEALTLNAPYPFCQEKSMWCSSSQREEFALKLCSALARVTSEGKAISRWTWLVVPPACKTGTLMLLPIPLRYRQSFAVKVPGILCLRSFVLYTQWTRTFGYVWAMVPSLTGLLLESLRFPGTHVPGFPVLCLRHRSRA